MLSNINSLINSDYAILFCSDKKQLKIVEDKNIAKNTLKGITISVPTGDIFALKLDRKNKRHVPVLSCSKEKINCVCDAVLFYVFSDQLYALFIELKSDEVKLDHVADQIIATKIFVRYLRELSEKMTEVPMEYKSLHFCFTSSTYKLSFEKERIVTVRKRGIDIKVIPAQKGINYQVFNICELIKFA